MIGINIAEQGDGRSTSSMDALSAVVMRFIGEYFSLFAARTIFDIFVSVTRGRRFSFGFASSYAI